MKRSPWLVFAIAIGAVLLGLIIHNARYGAVSPRIRNPNNTGDGPTAMRVVNAVPYVVAAPAGLLSSLDIPTTLPRHVFQ